MHCKARPTGGTTLGLPTPDPAALIPMPPWFRAAVNLARPASAAPVRSAGDAVEAARHRRQASRRMVEAHVGLAPVVWLWGA